MTKICLFIVLFTTQFLLNVSAQGLALAELAVLEAPQPGRSVQVRTLLSLKPPTPANAPNRPPNNGHWLLIVIDVNTATSGAFLRLFKQENFTPARSVLLVIGQRQLAEQASERGDFISGLPWASVDLAPAIKALKLKGTPMVYAIDEKNKIIWQRAGVPDKLANLVVRMGDWVVSNRE